MGESEVANMGADAGAGDGADGGATASKGESTLLEVSHLKKYFRVAGGRTLHAVDDVSFAVRRGTTLGIVGESGSGKTTCGKTCIGMLPKTAGEVRFDGTDVHTMGRGWRRAFSRRAQMVFQDPYSSLDPQQKVYDIVAEGIRIHRLAPSRAAEREAVLGLLEQVGLPAAYARRHAHEFSGGQRQRVAIARALSVNPDFLLLDEPVSALDVSLQAQIVNLLLRLQRERGLTMLFIAHDLAVVRQVSDEVCVMYLGQIVERAPADELYRSPAHPYTQALLSAVPVPDPLLARTRRRVVLPGDAPSPVDPGPGCRFRTRCPLRSDVCSREAPPTVEVAPGHTVTCHRRG